MYAVVDRLVVGHVVAARGMKLKDDLGSAARSRLVATDRMEACRRLVSRKMRGRRGCIPKDQDVRVRSQRNSSWSFLKQHLRC